MAELLLDALTFLCLVAGSIFLIISSLALLRLPDYYSRVHGAGITDTMGAGLVLLGLAFLTGSWLVIVKLALVLVFMVITGPTAAHALAKAAYFLGLKPRLGTREDERSAS